MAKIKIIKNDTVIVTTGNSKGVKGKVIKVYPKENKAMVEGANLISKHTKPNAANPQGGIIKQEAKIHISNLMLIDPKSGKPTKVGRTRDEKTGKLVRVAKKTGEVIK
ncbi:MAG: 50S ribosomal protein L24 [Cryomorphaceae bacterium BACL11 MAG-121001-bin54]|mgnify:FL=1|jgi:large subunit ribosomal protein L24|nr:MAG: 50S ribosomal protein L24 [Cryomorphaceae bacterium BACL11 MAG-121001-bin54]KRO65581.1 MAG: 50S ribosomal protein L24 [Cryomorphaceae bacterium BACL11 MAG-121015-bin20]KRO68599.1 MAG: 50S ribosomal protein L24 [Cryomorphaceae bacterium BACL11 MAG-121128-bin16]MDA1008944.1 50S ribosomal protein L24 [Bacteroidota bacterium]